MPKPFAVVVLQQHSVRLVGVRINTNLHQAPQDCPRLWNDVFAFLDELNPSEETS